MLRAILLLMSLLFSTGAAAEEVVDAEALAALEGAGHWPVVDVRDLADQSRVPIPGALEFGPELALSGPVLVVGSENSIARLTAVALESRFDGVQAYAVEGGIDTLRTIRTELLPSLGGDSMPGTFTIPSDTCQPGPALHTFSDEER
ncbi:MAG: hypothetical protein OQK94_02700 [Gammaproteobacteria bacterium]|nr:hypothetical protein [Gammaproteobacteria bacterium]MCW8840597.1 hypothetical protein [Gammaproteobacteria bacterium]MCW8928402.1 hypothetical protein [Gammaproteobacteria bacterium]MCW8957699.1 hypothetical protein [Gammaproteobacteria bacterium]MCW8972432.1 hypothetical protein [Gammaproteobacteria bacterium]